MWHNLYANPFTKFLGLVCCRVTSKTFGIVPFEINWKNYKHVQCGQRSRLQSDSYEKQAILYGASKMHKNFIIGTRCVYNWTDMMCEMGLDNIVNNDREPRHSRIFNAWIEDWDSDIMRIRDQDNEQRLLQKYNNIRLFDDEDNQNYIIAPEFLGLNFPPEEISAIVWLGRPSIGGMGKIWIY